MHHKNTKAAFAEAQRDVNINLKKLDILKPRIKKKYEQYLQRKRETEARRASLQEEYRSLETAQSKEALIPYSGQHIEASQNRDLAIKLAQKEISRRAAARSEAAEDDNDLSRQLQEVAASVEPQSRHAAPDRTADGTNFRFAQTIPSYKYPTIPANHVETYSEEPGAPRIPGKIPSLSRAYQSPPPLPPPKPSTGVSDRPPPKPEKPNRTSSVEQPTAYTFAPAAYLENGAPLRTLFLPPTLRTTFLRVAHKNTLASLETCAFLAGTLISNALFVSKLIVPAQTSTSDTCEMTNESQLFDYVDSEPDLMILGWIHTHPTQTCFMSSRDLHTHAGYQMMLAESVAVVCAPSKGDTSHGGEWGVYRLTDPPGKKTILACEKAGIFHPHDVDNIYTDALRPGHVVEAKGLEFELVDLRDKR